MTCETCGGDFYQGRSKGTVCRSCQRKIRVYKPRICAFPGCGEEFQPRNSGSFCLGQHSYPCDACGDSFEVKASRSHPNLCRPCRVARGNEARKKTSIEKYGVENAATTVEVKAKILRSNEERHGGTGFASKKTQEKIRATTKKRHGVEHPMESEAFKEKIEQTNIERYGVKNAQQNPEVRSRTKATNETKYGGSSPMASDEVRQKMKKSAQAAHGGLGFAAPHTSAKIRETMIERYGAANPMQSAELRSRIEATNLERYGTPLPFGSDEITRKLRITQEELYGGLGWGSEILMDRIKETYLSTLGVEWPSQSPKVQEKIRLTLEKTANDGSIQKSSRISKLNRSWAEKLEAKFGLSVKLESSFGSYSADIEIGGLLVDFNPTVSHNTAIPFGCQLASCQNDCGKHRRITPDYHYRRAMEALSLSRKLIQVFSWDSEEHVLQMLGGRIAPLSHKYSARKLSARVIPQKEANQFLSLNHLQGAARGQSYCLGLFDCDQLVAVATWGPSRFNANFEYEFIRYAVRRDSLVRGGAELAFRRFLVDCNPSSVISYVDFNHSTSPSLFLLKLDFSETTATGPALTWSNTTKRVSEVSLLRQGADRLLGTSYGPPDKCGLGNHEIMLLEGWLPVYTAGNRVFTWSR